jgi:hypothetical protein
MSNLILIPQEISITTVPTSGLTALQAAYAIFRSGGEFYVVDLQQLADVKAGKRIEVEFFKKQSAEVLLKRFLENQAIACELKITIAQFWTNPNTLVFDAVAFSPLPQPASTINYWIEPTAKPRAGNCDILRAFLFNIICAGCQGTYSYLLHYLAHMLQRPEEKPGIIIVLLGGQGTGKGTFFRLLRAIWGRTTIQVSDIQEVIGHFNAVLERHFVFCMDEALFSGDKKALDRLKSLVTEPTCRVEQKYQPARTIDSYHRFFAASNHDHFAHVERDDRRFVFLRVSDDAKGNHQFFNQLATAIENPLVVDAFAYELMNLDISHFNVRQKPQSSEQVLQKLRSLEGFSRFWFEVLTAGSLTGNTGNPQGWEKAVFISTSQLVTNYTEFDKKAQWYRTVQQSELLNELKRLCTSARYDRHQDKYQGQRRGWWLPDLVTARLEFERFIGGQVDWPVDFGAVTGFDTATLDAYWAGREPAKQTVSDILDAWDKEQ